MAVQVLLFPDVFCSCGQPAVKAGLCLRHYNAWYHSQRNFGGHRESVIERDGSICRVCQDSRALVVHHRAYVRDPEFQITLCRACHAFIHRSLSIRKWIPGTARLLWSEIHPGAPLQLQFDYAAESACTGNSVPSSSCTVYGVSAASTSSLSAPNRPSSCFMA